MPRSTRSQPASLKIRTPDNSLIGLDAGRSTFIQTHLPGIYAIESAAENQLFAVNLPAAECQTAAMPIENLERFGVSLEQSSGVAAERTEQARRHRSFAGLETEQKVWRWVFIALLAVSLIEIGLAGLLTRPSSVSEGEQK